MPELPEVTTVTSRLNSLIKGEIITSVEVITSKLVKESTSLEFSQLLKNKQILRVFNIGKFIIWEFKDATITLLSHMRMDGRFYLRGPAEGKDFLLHTRIIFNFKSGYQLSYLDTRGFGTFEIKKNQELFTTPPLSLLAPTPQEIDEDLFFKRVKKSSRAIKTLLLDQHIILGLGNIYVDETLFEAKILPTRSANTLTKKEAKIILEKASFILAEAIRLGGSSVHSFYVLNEEIGGYQTKLKVYSRFKRPCLVCSTPISKIKLNGRGTHFCINCQK